jgi:UDP-N-acetyl-D-glucosamine/UDP-N-acetyl-D-galactosamine dehydrogenase
VFTPYFRGADPAEAKHEYGINILIDAPKLPSHGGVGGGQYSAIILAVAHKEFLNINLQEHKTAGCIIYDVKGILDKDLFDARL